MSKVANGAKKCKPSADDPNGVREAVLKAQERRARRQAAAPSEAVQRERMFSISELAEGLELLDTLIQDSADVAYPAPSDLGIYIQNQGNRNDKCEAVLLLLPIAKRIHEREE